MSCDDAGTSTGKWWWLARSVCITARNIAGFPYLAFEQFIASFVLKHHSTFGAVVFALFNDNMHFVDNLFGASCTQVPSWTLNFVISEINMSAWNCETFLWQKSTSKLQFSTRLILFDLSIFKLLQTLDSLSLLLTLRQTTKILFWNVHFCFLSEQ